MRRRRPTRLVLALVFYLLTWCALPRAQAASELEAVNAYPERDAARFVFRMSSVVAFEVRPRAEGGPHVEVLATHYSGRRTLRFEGLVRALHVEEHGRSLRLRWETTRPVSLRAFYLPAPYRLVVDLASRETKRPREVTAADVVRPVSRVVLDPGHGGDDPGAVGPTGLHEKDVALEIAHRAAPLLARELGVSTLLTRDTDHRVPLEQRVAKANAFGADLFISIHCNADGSGRARGLSSYVLDGSEARVAVAVVERENRVTLTTRHSGDTSGFLRQFSSVDRTRKPLIARSRHLARLLQRATTVSLSDYDMVVDGGVHGAGFYVLAGARMPAVLFETSFISNPLEEDRLRQARYRQKLADGIVNAVRAYRAGY